MVLTGSCHLAPLGKGGTTAHGTAPSCARARARVWVCLQGCRAQVRAFRVPSTARDIKEGKDRVMLKRGPRSSRASACERVPSAARDIKEGEDRELLERGDRQAAENQDQDLDKREADADKTAASQGQNVLMRNLRPDIGRCPRTARSGFLPLRAIVCVCLRRSTPVT